MTDSQRERAKKIVKDRKEIEAKGKIIDLLLCFWEGANSQIQQNYTRITSIRCKNDVWTYYDEEKGKEMEECTHGEIKKSFDKIKDISYTKILAIPKKEIEELEEIGFSIQITAKNFEMKIKS